MSLRTISGTFYLPGAEAVTRGRLVVTPRFSPVAKLTHEGDAVAVGVDLAITAPMTFQLYVSDDLNPAPTRYEARIVAVEPERAEWTEGWTIPAGAGTLPIGEIPRG